jgi:protein SCO1/2
LTIPDELLTDEGGRRVHLLSDVIADRVVAINFIFTTCGTICPPLGANFGKLRHLLGGRAGSQVELISVTVDPETDTPARLKTWAAAFGQGEGPGWTLLTGDRRSIATVLAALGAGSPDKQSHTPLVLIGSRARGWTRAYGLSRPAVLLATIDGISIGHAAAAAGGPAGERTTAAAVYRPGPHGAQPMFAGMRSVAAVSTLEPSVASDSSVATAAPTSSAPPAPAAFAAPPAPATPGTVPVPTTPAPAPASATPSLTSPPAPTSTAPPPASPSSKGSQPSAAQRYFTDVVLVDQNGKEQRFYSDLLQGKTVVIDTFFGDCQASCPTLAANFAYLQDKLAAHLGHDLVLLSISVDPVNDTPEKLKRYAERFNAKPGWLFLTGSRDNVKAALGRLGQWVDDRGDHNNILLVGNDRTGLWKKGFGLAKRDDVLTLVQSVLEDGR